MFNELIADSMDRFQIWIGNKNVSTTITNLRKHYYNRAQKQLEMEQAWDEQVVQETLTLTGNQATIPTNALRVVAVGHDYDGDKKPDWYYFNQADQGRGYSIIPNFSKATGRSNTLYLYIGFPYTINAFRYQKALEDFEDSGDEYSFFPTELLFSTAQLIRAKEKNAKPSEYNTILIEQQRLLKNFKSAQYQNMSFKRSVNSHYGQRIEIDAVDLTGNMQTGKRYLRNDQDV